jgi:hypothetical protein
MNWFANNNEEAKLDLLKLLLYLQEMILNQEYN